jgi:acetyl esterase/lipase
VTPATSSVRIGESLQLSATLVDGDGNPLPTSGVIWTSSDSRVAQMSADGLVSGLSLGGPITITATVGSTSGRASINVIAGPPAQLTIETQPDASAESGVALARQPVIQLRDEDGNAAPQAGVTVTAIVAQGQGSLDNDTAVTDAQGRATFSGLTLSGTAGTYLIRFESNGLTDVTSGAVTLGVGPPASVTIDVAPPAVIQNGEPFSTQPQVIVLDAAGNPVAGTSVVATMASGEGTLGGTTVVDTDGMGVAAFIDLSITGLVGARTLRFSASEIDVISTSIDVVAGEPQKVTISQQPPGFAIDGVTFAQSPIVTVEDASGNPVPSVDLVATIESGGGSLNGTTTVATTSSGSATFSTLSLAGSPGERTLRFTYEGIQSVSNVVHLSLEEGSYLDLQYCGSHVLQRLDVYVPDNSFPRPRPVVAYVHGGSWISHDKSEEDLLLWANVRAELLSRGYVVTTLNYRLATADPSTKWPAAIQDVKCAMRHLRADGLDYGADGDQIGVWGASAGGHLVAMLGVTDGVSPTVHDFEAGLSDYSGVSSAVQATIMISGISDMTWTQAPDHDELDISGGATAFTSWPGESDELDEASPIWWASSDDPPFLIIHGEEDTTVDVAQGQRLFDYLDTAGAGVVELVRVLNADHDLQGVTGSATPSVSQLVQRVSDFFDTHIPNGS